MAGKLEEETDPVPNSLIQWKLVSTALMTIGRCLFYRNSRNDCGIGSEEDDRLEKKRMDGTFTSNPRDWQSLCGKKSGSQLQQFCTRVFCGNVNQLSLIHWSRKVIVSA
ncbi:hypothetical protein Y032_0012g1795 [Ancylostoma ceylanicum]|uniref:Uncharacterized protein n=1 Tax=Ancylostoma ceylanicum TaxID=53326 RepID=A0A016VEU5_9BILA|nr:hypothetical protein Y032_0012g1795 [Ancylostoma ceylanicum]